MKEFELLYKYREWNKYTKESLENNYLWFSHVDEFNDPFELFHKTISGIRQENVLDDFSCYFKFLGKNNIEQPISTDILYQQLKDAEPGIINQILNIIEKVLQPLQNNKIKELKDTTKIFSLSFHNNHPLLWGHYANGLNGLCIEYDLNKEDQPLVFGYCPVDYNENPLIINVLEMLRSGQTIHDFSEQIYATKHQLWHYEKEFRLIADEEKIQGNKVYLKEKTIKSIIIGEKLSPEYKKEIKDIALKKGIDLYQAVAIPSEFKIDICKYEI